MKLVKYLRKQSYDLIEGPVRNHKPLQLWVKKAFNEVDLYYKHIDHAFKSDVQLNEEENPALSVSSKLKDEYGFNIGITLLEEVLKSIGMGAFEISAKIKSGRKISISYENSISIEVPIGEIESYLATADFKHPNPPLYNNANKGNIIIISGILFAKNLIAEIETDIDVDSELVAELNEGINSNISFNMKKNNVLKMVSSSGNYFPIAVKAHRLIFDKGELIKLRLTSDNNNWF